MKLCERVEIEDVVCGRLWRVVLFLSSSLEVSQVYRVYGEDERWIGDEERSEVAGDEAALNLAAFRGATKSKMSPDREEEQ